MKTYFLSSKPCALTINDAFFGVTDLFERFAELRLADNLFLRFSPQDALPVGFFFNENIRFQAPQGVEVYFVKDGVALYVKDFPPIDYSLRPVAQNTDGDTAVTVFIQGNPQVSIQTPTDFFNDTLPPSFAQCEITFTGGLIFLASPTQLAVYTRQGKRVFLETVRKYQIQNDTLTAVLPLNDAWGREARCTYTLHETGLMQTAFSISQRLSKDGTHNPATIQEELLAFAFFETVRIGGDFTAFLDEELQQKADSLRAFLGHFTAVIPTSEPNVCGLVKPVGERIFDTAYYTLTLKDGKICDITG